MAEAISPLISVVLITPNDFGALRKTVRHLCAQTVRDRLELIIVAPEIALLRLDESELQGFAQFKLVEVGPITSTGKALAAGIRAAGAPLVAYAEEHSYPDARWAEALIRAHAQPWAGVGAVLANANPCTRTSWAHLYTDFGPWVDPAAPVEALNLGGHHTAYKRGVLLEFGSALDALLETDLILNSELRARGYKLYLEPTAKSYHLNCSRFLSHVRATYHGGRLFGAARAKYEDWSFLRRVLYIGGAPLIPVVRFWRIWLDIRRSGREHELLPGILPPMIAGLMSHTLGEVVGYALGSGDAAQKRITFELQREQHIVEQDKIADEVLT